MVVLAEVLALVAAGSGWQLSTDPRLVGQPFEHRASARVALGRGWRGVMAASGEETVAATR